MTTTTRAEAAEVEDYMDAIREVFERIRETCEACQAVGSAHPHPATKRVTLLNRTTGETGLTMALCDTCTLLFLFVFYRRKFREMIAGAWSRAVRAVRGWL